MRTLESVIFNWIIVLFTIKVHWSICGDKEPFILSMRSSLSFLHVIFLFASSVFESWSICWWVNEPTWRVLSAITSKRVWFFRLRFGHQSCQIEWRSHFMSFGFIQRPLYHESSHEYFCFLLDLILCETAFFQSGNRPGHDHSIYHFRFEHKNFAFSQQ